MSAFDVVEAFHISHAIAALHNLKILELLKRGYSLPTLARKCKLPVSCLKDVLCYVAARTNLVERNGEVFRCTDAYSNQALYLLDLYLGAYHKNAVKLHKLLGKAGPSQTAVDRERYARAFKNVAEYALGGTPEIIEQLKLNFVLDLGCGMASLLLRLASDDVAFNGWGVEINPAMCREARAAIRKAGLGRRVKLYEGSAMHLDDVIPTRVRNRVQSITACQVANEMFAQGAALAVTWLRGLKRTLPGRLLLLSDYYGRLGMDCSGADRATLLHDYVQLISGQGVPPANLASWQSIYREASVDLVHVIEDKKTTRFVHIIKL